ncbi:hypothetical protein [Halorubrum sp. BOL3-1]|uniref:hypothetical protein n=1 Tax=Halorubrum sp. BOL3-1 TaxID=2497325 RepID=UPI001F4FB879|nr:hypothetical protein [Halorubrum sp. BOL3-1]
MNYKEVAVGQRLNDTFDLSALSAAFDWLEVIPITPDAPSTRPPRTCLLRESSRPKE